MLSIKQSDYRGPLEVILKKYPSMVLESTNVWVMPLHFRTDMSLAPRLPTMERQVGRQICSRPRRVTQVAGRRDAENPDWTFEF